MEVKFTGASSSPSASLEDMLKKDRNQLKETFTDVYFIVYEDKM